MAKFIKALLRAACSGFCAQACECSRNPHEQMLARLQAASQFSPAAIHQWYVPLLTSYPPRARCQPVLSEQQVTPNDKCRDGMKDTNPTSVQILILTCQLTSTK